MEHLQPSYLNLSNHDFLRKKQALYEILKECRLCPRECRVNRIEGEIGYCKAPKQLVVSSIGPHFGEERELVGKNGSGTIFFSHCSLRCIFCQNYEISHLGYGKEVTEDELSEKMIFLQKISCHNINLVTPTHYVPQIVSALYLSSKKGLSIPIVYNSSGYERVETLKILEGIIDIYMPDMKYGTSEPASLYSNASDYFEISKRAIKEMHRQVGDLIVEEKIAKRGLLVRHLVLPNNEAGTHNVMDFISSLSKDTYVNIMDQYRPLYQADKFPKIGRRITWEEYKRALNEARRLNLYRGFCNV
ncbi:MAG: radical SAM protein [bacterium]